MAMFRAPGLPAATASPACAVTLPLYDGDKFITEVEVFQATEGENLPFTGNEIRIRHLSPPSERCPPLAVLQAIKPYAMCCKLRAKPLPPKSGLHLLHFVCLSECRTAVVQVGDEELHLVAMKSKEESVPCFWCWSARSDLYAACLGMLNQRCLTIVFDLDETLVVSNTMATFDNRINRLSELIASEDDACRLSAMGAEFDHLWKDKKVLQEFIQTNTITVNGRIVMSKKEEVLLPKPGGGLILVVRPVIRVPERNVVLTRINPKVPNSSVFVNIRPGWDFLKSYLTANGRPRFKVSVCTMSGRDYAHEIWRLLDPEANLISSEELSQRLVCVKPDSKKSLQLVFQERLCHPKMTMVIDDRLEVWDEKDKRQVHVVPAYNPSLAPQDLVVNALPVLHIVTHVACSARGGFFREFDGKLLTQVHELMYENAVLDLPFTPDVGDHLVKENHEPAPIPEETSAADVEGSLNGQASAVGSSNMG